MPEMTVEQAAEYGKTLSFEKVWAMFAETDRKFAETDRKFAESVEQSKETNRKFAESAEQLTRLEKTVERVSNNIDGVNRSLGRWVEQMVASKLWEKFGTFGYVFTKGGKNIKFLENGRTIAEADVFLENGEFVMPVETKTDLTLEDVNDHLDRIQKIRLYMDKHKDKRIIVGAVAGAIVPDHVCTYAQKKGLYVLVQSGDSVAVAEMPETFKPQTW